MSTRTRPKTIANYMEAGSTLQQGVRFYYRASKSYVGMSEYPMPMVFRQHGAIGYYLCQRERETAPAARNAPAMASFGRALRQKPYATRMS